MGSLEDLSFAAQTTRGDNDRAPTDVGIAVVFESAAKQMMMMVNRYFPLRRRPNTLTKRPLFSKSRLI